MTIQQRLKQLETKTAALEKATQSLPQKAELEQAINGLKQQLSELDSRHSALLSMLETLAKGHQESMSKVIAFLEEQLGYGTEIPAPPDTFEVEVYGEADS